MQQGAAEMVHVAEELLASGELWKGLQAVTKAIPAAKKQGDHRLVYKCLMMQGSAHLQIDQFADALKYFKSAVRLGTSEYGKDSKEYVQTLEQMADCFAGMRKWDKARKVLNEALPVKEELFGRGPVYGMLLEKVGRMNMHCRKYPDAMDQLEEARRLVDPASRDGATVLASLAVTYAKMKEFSSSVRMRTLQLNVVCELYGDRHLEYAKVLHSTALAHALADNFTRCVEMLQEVVQLREELLGPDDLLTVAAAKDLKHYGEQMLRQAPALPQGVEERRGSLPLRRLSLRLSGRRFSSGEHTIRVTASEGDCSPSSTRAAHSLDASEDSMGGSPKTTAPTVPEPSSALTCPPPPGVPDLDKVEASLQADLAALAEAEAELTVRQEALDEEEPLVL